MPAIVVIPQGVEELLISLATSSRMNRPGTRYASLLRLPACVGNWEADAAGPVTNCPRVLFGEEEDTVGDIAAPGDGAQLRRWTLSFPS